ncbi:sulfatase [Oryzihumus sp.]|jgi:arylsulfatase A-like enzyme|uniref:sulfatase family protein n=1 Tax=Oryzihumus sp. TaxID=1968903 RepID=UPI002ED82407
MVSGRRRSRSTARLIVLALVVVTWVLASLVSPPFQAATVATAATRPNVLVVVTDDQLDGTVTPQVMPNLYREMVQSGVEFTNGFVSNSWCCPSRASILTGQYSGHNGVWTTGGTWGLKAWRPHEGSTLATWMHAAGYRTGIVGKYMNGFAADAATTYTPAGWDTTAIPMDLTYKDGAGFYNYDLWENGHAVHYGTAPNDYSTRVFTQKARTFIAPSNDTRPWFLYLAYTAPHGPGGPDPLDTSAGAGVTFPMPPSVCEKDVSDKPAFIRSKPLCSITPTQYSNKMRDQQLRMLASVDRGLGQVFSDLRASGALGNTLVLFTSDNGHELWEHRVRVKELPYEESIRVPLLARWDALGSAAVGTRTQLALNIDIAPTVVEAAGVAQHGSFDGASLLPAMAGASAPSRPDFLIEHKMLNSNDEGGPSYCGVRTPRWKFVLYQTGERELYDLTADPYELRSLHRDAAYRTTMASLEARAKQLCAPPPPGWTP